MPRFDQSFSGICEQNLQDTLQLKQRYLDAKNKRTPKSKDKKQQDSIQSSVHVVQQKFLKRPSEEHDSGGHNDGFEPPVKLQCTTQHGTHQPEGLTKFSVEIVQQLEFTTSAANSQPQQISTNVTVKALTNASVKSDVGSPKSNPSTPVSNLRSNSGIVSADIGTLIECVKQEPDNDFADLDQCAAALEKDAAANGGAGFGGLSDLIGDDTNDEIITSDAFKDLISDLQISNYPDLMKEFDFDEKNDSVLNGLKVEDTKDMALLDGVKNTHSPLLQNQNRYSPVFDAQGMGKNRMSYPNMDFGKTELSPAAQTLKQMAEQHQHKNQMGLSFAPNNRGPNSRSPYPDFPYQGDYGSPNSNQNFHKSNPNFPPAELIKQEIMFQGNEYDMKRKGAGIYKQQYSPYGSPSASSHDSPGYLPRTGTGANTPGGGPYQGGTPPRPSSGPGGTNSGTTLQINQAQQLHISQQGQGHAIQVSAGQHLHLSGDLKGNVSVATQQGMYFNHHQNANNQNQNSQHNAQTNPQQQNHHPNAGNQQPHTPGGPQQSNSVNHHPGTPSHQLQNSNMQQNMNPSLLVNQQHPNAQNTSQTQSQGNMSVGNSIGMGGGGMPVSAGMSAGGLSMGAGNMMTGPGGIPVSNMSGGHGGGIPVNQHHPGLGDSYSMSQTQTINFTQQSLRQRTNGVNVVQNSMGPMSAAPMGGMGPRHISPQVMEQQKLLQQQQMLRAQQAAMQQQMGVRPPPPDYKTSAGLMQGMRPRYPSGPPTMGRMPAQPMPPSGPMIRHNMYMMQQQQHIATRGVYPRAQAAMTGPDTMPPHGSAEWRHLLMTQQQNANFNNQMRPNFQHQATGFNMNAGNMQMAGLQQQQMRIQQGMVSSVGQQGMAHSMSQSGPMTQMSTMNHQMLSQMQQQQIMQQNSSQMATSNISMQQMQSMSLSNQTMHQQNSQLINQHHQLMNNPSNNNAQNNSLANFNSTGNDFNLDFLDSFQTPDSNSFNEQELLSSFDTDSGLFSDML